jgi:hypothetical protein
MQVNKNRVKKLKKPPEGGFFIKDILETVTHF